MKRKIVLSGLTLALAATLVGCGNTASTTSPAPSASPSPEVSADPVSRGVERAVDDWNGTMNNVGNAVRNATGGTGTTVPNYTNERNPATNGSTSGGGAWMPGGELQSSTR